MIPPIYCIIIGMHAQLLASMSLKVIFSIQVLRLGCIAMVMFTTQLNHRGL